MECITPNGDLTVHIQEKVLNFIITKFHHERPELFRIISKGLDGSSKQFPIKIGETGHLINFNINLLPPPDGRKYVDCYPASHSFNLPPVQKDEALVQFRVRFEFHDIEYEKTWDPFSLEVGLICKIEKRGEKIILQITCSGTPPTPSLDILGLLPSELEQGIEHALAKLLNAALENMQIPANYFAGEPANVRLTIGTIEIVSDKLIVPADMTFST
ncbi:MAG TPA: hypothetical protein PLI09_08265 [Candidatus Hydrogenedentes bacterium]|nr:hypothetical protein [Candidatus Hydrogenedentota bacterium]